MQAATLAPRRNLLDHTFYRRWVTGDLSLDELRAYACEYAHVVAALPRWLRQSAQVTPGYAAELDQHAREEDGHVTLWRKFARSPVPEMVSVRAELKLSCSPPVPSAV